MKIKQIRKSVLGFISFFPCIPFATAYSFHAENNNLQINNFQTSSTSNIPSFQTATSSLRTSENSLYIATPNNEINKMLNFNFSYNSSSNNVLYINESNKNKIAKIIALYMFQNYDFFFDDALNTVSSVIKQEYEKISSNKGLVYSKLENTSSEPLLSFFYFLKYENSMLGSAGIKVSSVPIMKYLKWNNIGNDQYTISFTIPYTWTSGPRFYLDNIKANHKLIDIYYQTRYENEFITIGFGNIIFRNIANNISNFSYTNIDPMDLTYEKLKILFKLNNSLIPSSLSYTMEKSDGFYKINIKKITYEIKDIQKFNLYYEGNYSVVFTKSNYEFNWDVIKSRHNLISLSTNDLWNELVINQSYKNMINNISLSKDYQNNKIRIDIDFNKYKYQNLLLFTLMEQLFKDQSFEIKLDTDSSVNFYVDDKYEHILFKNFNLDLINAKFNLLPYDLKLNKIELVNEDLEKETISFKSYLSTTINKINYDFSVFGIFTNFENYNFWDIEKITNFFNNNFYDEEQNLDIEKIEEVFKVQSNWSYLLDHSKNLIFKNLKIDLNDDENKFVLSFDIFNNKNLYLDSSFIEIKTKEKIVVEDNEESEETNKPEEEIVVPQKKKSNLNYLWFLILLIPAIIISIKFKYFKKKK